MKYILRDNETGECVFGTFDTREEAEQELKDQEEQDKKDGTYEEDYYEIVEKEVMNYEDHQKW